MRRLLFTLLLVFTGIRADAQQVFVGGQSLSALPPGTLDLKTVIDILADYDVKHYPEWVDDTAYGSTNLDTRTIKISDKPSASFRRNTVIHELLHAMYGDKGLYTGGEINEVLIDAKTKELFRQIYAPEFKDQP